MVICINIYNNIKNKFRNNLFYAVYVVLFLVVFSQADLFSQMPRFDENIRITLWAELDAYPGLKEAENTSSSIFAYSINRLKQITPFIINGMVNGWTFSYTPSDKLRGVEEVVEFSEIRELGVYEKNIKYADPLIKDNRVNCWVEFKRTPTMIQNYKLWSSINNDTIQGVGYGDIADGFDGIVEATKDAIKNAVRNYFRTKVKNKPKEITGKVLIRREPLFGIDAGRYKVQLDFFLETDKILPYTQY